MELKKYLNEKAFVNLDKPKKKSEYNKTWILRFYEDSYATEFENWWFTEGKKLYQKWIDKKGNI